MAARPAPGRSAAPKLKSKFIAAYESFFKGEDPSAGRLEFWDELLLLSVNAPFLERCVMLSSEEQLLLLKDSIQKIFVACLRALKGENKYRVTHAIETMTILLRHIFRKKFSNFGVDVVNLITGIETADAFFREFSASISSILCGDWTSEIKYLAVQLLLVISTATDNINQNSLVQYFILHDLFGALVKIIAESQDRGLAYDTLFLLVLLANYHKYETRNPYSVSLSEAANPALTDALVAVILHHLTESQKQFISALETHQRGTGAWSSLWSSGPAPTLGPTVQSGITSLLLYELLHLNRSFFNTVIDVKRTLKTGDLAPPADQVAGLKVLSKFLSLASFVLLHLRDLSAASYGKLCLLSFLCLTESDTANALLHDPRLNLSVALFQRSRASISSSAPTIAVALRGKDEPLIAVIFDLLVDFMRHHLKKNLQAELYIKAINNLHAALCYQKKFRIRITYRWKEIWACMFAIMKQISTDEMFAKPEVKALSRRIAVIFNFFITYGDTFLASPADYDELYYELIRLKPTVDTFYQKVYEHDKQVCTELENMRTIVNHFTARLDTWAMAHPETPLSPPMVVSIIKANYETLKLQLLEGLDQYETYLENPREVSFFRLLIRNLVFEYRLLPAHQAPAQP